VAEAYRQRRTLLAALPGYASRSPWSRAPERGARRRHRAAALGSLFFVATCARLGRTDEALDVTAEALESIERTDERWLEPELHRLRGELLWPKDAARGEREIRTAIAIARERSSASLQLRAALSGYRLSSDAKRKRARDEVAQALAGITGGADAPDIIEARTIVAK
jgi:hypothetical protein